jgi:LysR family glycine cleavage system transcriptional activator
MPPLNALRAFEAAARLKSLSRAGDELCVTHAAVSHQVKQLEQWLGRRLLRRRGRGVIPTQAGFDLALTLSESFANIAQASAALKKSTATYALSVGCIPSIASRWLVPQLANFSGLHPEISVQVSYARADERIGDTAYDVLITLGEDFGPGVQNVKLFSRENKPVCSRYYWEKYGPLKSQHSIRDAPLLHDESREAWRDWFVKAGIHQDGDLKGPIFADFNLLAGALLAGHGVALCPVEVFRNEIAQRDLVVLSDIATLEDRGYFLTVLDRSDAAVLAFKEWFVTAVAIV